MTQSCIDPPEASTAHGAHPPSQSIITGGNKAASGDDRIAGTDAEIIDQLCNLAARVDIATATMLGLLSEIDERAAWGGPGIKSCAHWLSWRCGIGAVAARSHVRVARALRDLPRIRAEFTAGRLSYAKVRAITRIADADNEDDLVDLAHSATAAQVERTVRAWRRVDDLAQPELERRREVQWHWDDDGMFILRARLSADEGAIILAALQAVRISEPEPKTGAEPDAEPERTQRSGVTPEGPEESWPQDVSADSADDGASEAPTTTIPRNRLTGNDPNDVSPAPVESPSSLAEASAHRIEALVGIARAFLDPLADVDRDPEHHIVVHVDSRVLSEDAVAGRAAYESGGAISAAMARRLACDCAVVALLRDGDDVLDLGRPSRRISRRMRRALLARDGGCAFPSCCERRPSRLQAHHVWHWADGGPTELSNLLLLCRAHHRCVHEDGYRVSLSAHADRFLFVTPTGEFLERAPHPSQTPAPLPRAAVDVQAIPQWAGDRLELGFVISVLRDARNLRRSARERLIGHHDAAEMDDHLAANLAADLGRVA